MCGIFGLVHRTGEPLQPAVVAKALTQLRHRGPDDEGYLFGDALGARTVLARGNDTAGELSSLRHWATVDGAGLHVALAHRRLSILDLSAAGHQPMPSADRRHWITFNGEIYNFIEVRQTLTAAGHTFSTECDTEVLLAAYAEWGEDMLSRLVGMFAFAIWDIPKRRMLLARDPFGIKPLYIAQDDDHFAFASEAKALLTLPWVRRDVDPQALFRYLRFGAADSGDATLLRSIRQLPPACLMTVPLGEGCTVSAPRRYWRLSPSVPRDIPMAEAALELKRLFEESIALHLRSDVPLGSCFSGGLDSSAIVLTASSHVTRRMQVFSYINDVASLSEEPYVDLVASTAPIDVHKVRPSQEDVRASFEQFMGAQDFPVGSASVYAQYCVFGRARADGMTVMLDGQGSDEIFGGYPTALAARMTGQLARGDLAGMLGMWRNSTFADARVKKRSLLAALGRFLPGPLVGTFLGLAGEPVYPAFIAADWFDERGVVPDVPKRGRGTDALRAELVYFVDELSLPQLLRFEDRNSMAFSIESRVPFCVPAIAEFAMSLPPHLLVDDHGRGKAVLREAMRGVVPDTVIDRPKLGFSTSEGQWFGALGDFTRDARQRVRDGLVPFLDPDGVDALFDRASAGHFDNTAWRVFSVIRWAELLSARPSA